MGLGLGLAPHILTSTLPRYPRTCPRPHLSVGVSAPSPPPTPRSTVRARAVSPVPCLRTPRQQAYKFNQPLSWDTSRVSNMWLMFYVLLSAALCAPHLQSCPPHCARAACTAVGRCLLPPGPQPAPPLTPRKPSVRPACDPRQYAHAFNQPLSWDTSSVTTMHAMFYVRASPASLPRPMCAPNLQSRPRSCTLLALHALLFRLGRGPRVVGSSENRNRHHVATA